MADNINVSRSVARYAVQVVAATRNMHECAVGSSPRGSIALLAAAKANALMRGRSYVIPDDIKYLAPYVLGHRVQLSHEARVEGLTPKDVIDLCLDSVAIPMD